MKSTRKIKYAKEKYPKKKFKVIKKKIPYPKNFFDTIVLIEIIEHLTNKEINNLLKNSNRVLKENGGFGFLEIGMLMIFLSAFLYVVLNGLKKLPLVAKNHPMLEESLHHDI